MKVAICDDDISVYNKYSQIISDICLKNNIVVQIQYYKSGDNILFEWEDDFKQADILFLDINMPGTDGIETANRLREMGYKKEIIFLTKHDKKVFSAFDVNAFHYIIKDKVGLIKFEKIFLNAVRVINRKTEKYITFSCGGESRNIAINDIIYFETIKHIIVVHYNNEKFEFYSTLGKIENQLGEYGIIRVHKSYLVSKRYIKCFANNECEMLDGNCIPVGRNYRKLLVEGNYKRRGL